MTGEENEAVWLEALDYQDILNSAPDAMVLVDAQGVIRLVNKQTEKIFGYARDELSGEPIDILVPADYSGHHPKLVDRYLAKPVTRSIAEGLDLAARAKDGSIFPVGISLSPIDALPEMLAKLGVLLEDDDAGAVDFTHEIAQHPAVQEHQAAVSELVRQVEEYDFDTALKTLRQLMQQFIADSNG